MLCCAGDEGVAIPLDRILWFCGFSSPEEALTLPGVADAALSHWNARTLPWIAAVCSRAKPCTDSRIGTRKKHTYFHALLYTCLRYFGPVPAHSVASVAFVVL